MLALPRGGVPVAEPVARALDAELDVLVVRKLGAPGHEELAIGAICGDIQVVDKTLIRQLGITEAEVSRVARRERAELERRASSYRGERAALYKSGRILVLVDDGMATGSTMLAACRAMRSTAPTELVVAVPVAAHQAVEMLGTVADRVVTVSIPRRFGAVGSFYDDFSQTSDREVKRILASVGSHNA